MPLLLRAASCKVLGYCSQYSTTVLQVSGMKMVWRVSASLVLVLRACSGPPISKVLTQVK